MENAGLLLPTESLFLIHPIFDLVQPKSVRSCVRGSRVFFDLVMWLVEDIDEFDDCPRFSCLLVRLAFVKMLSSLESSEDDSSSDDSGDCLFFEIVALGLIFLFVSLTISTESDDAERFLPDVIDFFLFTELADMELSDEDDDEEGEDGNSSFRLEPFLLELCLFSWLLLW